ncbi:class II fructose-bisphosphate aldolase [Naumannella halotolerans]|uniref:Fructose-bisphosphate aldolase class II n=1 Tax=Naumannella halotolerans TaxID=993414 RepID=A0A4R7J9Q9_9ACTN|nr:class II fructose-bisphosphate aldolase [Naumannella halotolerans]TDT34281.1 fructose-bisphosphate aldolase class II [Naumannella halotolerans]
MPIRPTLELIDAAARQNVGIGAFNVIHLESAEALVAGAEDAGLPVILQISENCVKYHGGQLTPILAATSEIARQAAVDVALHLDHAEDESLAIAGIEGGFGSVMYDGSRLPHEANLATTQRVVALAHERGVSVEAELGEVAGKDLPGRSAHEPGVLTDPEQARVFVAETGVDALAVAVGSRHAMTERNAVLDLELITRLRDAAGVPLVLHGSSGVDDATLVAAIAAGMTKINVSTHLNQVFTSSIRRSLSEDPGLVDSRKYLGPARIAMAAETARLLRLFRGA